MSIIMDGMDQQHCHIPYLGRQQSFAHSIHQGIVRVKEHGVVWLFTEQLRP
jgi:hypothetical protein